MRNFKNFLWTLSKALLEEAVYGDQTGEQYSRMGRTSNLNSKIKVRKLLKAVESLLRKPSILKALLTMLLM